MAELAFIDKVAERAGVPDETARLLTKGTLLTLAARISGGEAHDLAERVPDELRPYLIKPTEPAESFSYDEFMRRVAEYAGVDRPTAERGVAAVLSALHETVGHKEFTDATAQLPREFGELVATASAVR
ncbi:DUF2267 domain-containing protein [Actinoplanes siamensis]|uniref:DUF2267 domain-containing protein n=1 Tax=Actinoplanes siamensis TaxID=1223317 RepID=A0A919KBZ7_9ACTN|nr:DUF2267 domain-containing protein [Actinoplanes siamensis]GIF02740.1 hypothetical protein Asi03nite_02780 [Actinoplanes siamensis]